MTYTMVQAAEELHKALNGPTTNGHVLSGDDIAAEVQVVLDTMAAEIDKHRVQQEDIQAMRPGKPSDHHTVVTFLIRGKNEHPIGMRTICSCDPEENL